jgi:hypothetical protein
MIQLNANVASIILAYANYFEYADILDELFPSCRKQCYNRHIKKITDTYCNIYKLFGIIHRENDLPAIEKKSRNMWYYCGLIHRDGDKPASEWANGTKKIV